MNVVAAPVGEDGSSVRCAVLGLFIRYLYTYLNSKQEEIVLQIRAT